MPSIPLPVDINPTRLSDWLEINALIEADMSSDLEDLRSLLKSSHSDQEIDQLIDLVISELNLRKFYLNGCYPFVVTSSLIALDIESENINWAYIFCLLLAYIGPDDGDKKIKTWNQNEITYLFENLCTVVSRNYVHNQEGVGQAIQFGAPRHIWPTKSKGFQPALKYLRSQIREGVIKAISKQHTYGDGGLDIVAWREFPDNRQGKILMLGQCASSKSDYRTKSKSNELGNFLTDCLDIESQESQCLRAFFIPHFINIENEEGKDDWAIINRRAIVFDRARIAHYGKNWESGELEFQIPKIFERLKKYKGSL